MIFSLDYKVFVNGNLVAEGNGYTHPSDGRGNNEFFADTSERLNLDSPIFLPLLKPKDVVVIETAGQADGRAVMHRYEAHSRDEQKRLGLVRNRNYGWRFSKFITLSVALCHRGKFVEAANAA
ncbi:hypothetical protein [Aureimonas altamirensis]|uniref:hypothetical protein n=1 Tax=Aureimonas altamirensis TaxID=370622 RepID=UPI002552D3E8|nr:hypothetical protein [Aureimonas altamirensis]